MIYIYIHLFIINSEMVSNLVQIRATISDTISTVDFTGITNALADLKTKVASNTLDSTMMTKIQSVSTALSSPNSAPSQPLKDALTAIGFNSNTYYHF